MNDVSLFYLFCTFFYIGLFTVGGGLVAITLMQETIVDKGLISAEQFYNMVAISESTPGPIGVNMATYLGYNFFGIPGALITTLGEILPSIICILIIAKFLTRFQNRLGVKSVFTCLRPAATGLVFVAMMNVIVLSLINVPENIFSLFDFENLKSLFKIPQLIFFVPMTVITIKTKLHPVVLILLGACFGMIFL